MDSISVGAALRAFDGRHVGPLKTLVQEGLDETGLAALLAAVPGPDEVAATWVLKALVEAEPMPDVTPVFDVLDEVAAPDAILHILQMVQHRPDQAKSAAGAITALLDHKRGLVRVWALDALVRLSPADPTTRNRVMAALTAKEAAMRARARALAELVEPPLA